MYRYQQFMVYKYRKLKKIFFQSYVSLVSSSGITFLYFILPKRFRNLTFKTLSKRKRAQIATSEIGRIVQNLVHIESLHGDIYMHHLHQRKLRKLHQSTNSKITLKLIIRLQLITPLKCNNWNDSITEKNKIYTMYYLCANK